jgi:hypothetical protein
VNYDGTIDPSPQVLTVGPYRLTVMFDGVAAATTTQPIGDDPAKRGAALPASGGMICFTAADAYTIVGTGLKVRHEIIDGSGDATGLLEVEEWRLANDGVTWSPFRGLNGDQTHQGREVRLPPGAIGMQTVRLFRFR